MLNECIFSHSPPPYPPPPANGLHPFPPTRHNSVCLECLCPRFSKRWLLIIQISLDSSGGLRHIALMISFGALNTTESGVYVCPFAFCVCPLPRENTPDLQGHLLAESPPREWGGTRRRKRDVGAMQPGSRSQRGYLYVTLVGKDTWCGRSAGNTNTYPGRGSHAAAPDTRGGAQRGGKCPRPRGLPWRRKALPFRFRPRGRRSGALA